MTSAGALIPVNVNFIWIVGLLIGMFQGGIQATSRSYFARLIPDKEDSNEYFGFFSVFSKFSSILGPMAISVLIMITGQTNIGILGLIPMMLIGAVLLFFVKTRRRRDKTAKCGFFYGKQRRKDGMDV